MDRRQKILKHINPKGYGLEIGPSFSPIAPKKNGYMVHTIDHMSRDQLIAKYKGHPVNFDNIEEVDFVWQGDNYAELTGKSKFYDWIIASHLIEHTPDLIGFFKDCDAILKDDGVISLVIPDKRYCFDHYRPVTDISQVIDSHLRKSTIHSPGTVAGYFLNVVSKGERIGWEFGAGGDYNLIHTVDDAVNGMKSVTKDKAYIDVHAWCFVPHSFRLIIHDLYSLGLIPFQEIDFFETDNFEFYVTLGRKGKGITTSRLEIMRTIESEVSEKNGWFKMPMIRLNNFARRVVRFLKKRLSRLFK